MTSKTSPLARRLALPGAILALFAVTACGETGISDPIAAGSITPIGGATRTGVAGQTLAEPIEVQVKGTDNQPLPGVQVTFAATGDGAAVNPATATTDASGIARTQWTLARTAGPSALTASVAGGVSTIINATAAAAPAASVAISAGNNQTAAAGAAVATAPAVRVLDAFGNPVAGAPVTFSVLSGGGRVTDFIRTTNAQGIATVGSWVLGPTTGQHTLLARVEQGGVTNNPVAFTATATAGAAAQVTALSATTQTGPAGAAVASPPSVRVTDANGNPVSGVTVTFAVTSGGGQLTGATATTNAQGIATAGSWTLGAVAGPNSVSATVAGAGSVSFSAIGTAGTATQLVLSAGNNQSAQVNRPVPIAPTVIARDALGNPVAGVVVTFTATAGGGTVIGSRVVTDVTGTAAVGAWFLGQTPGANTLSASAPGLTPVTFTATATPGVAVTMTPNSATTQTGVVAMPVADPPSVVVRDISGNPVGGVAVTFTVTAGGGTVTGSPVTSNANGVATLTSWTLGTQIVTNTVVASAAGLPSVTFTATPTAGAAANIVAVGGNNGVAVQGTATQSRPSVRVTDANGNVVIGAIVTFEVTGGGGGVTGGTQATDAAGVATVGSWILGTGVPNTLSASVAGTNVTGNPVNFTAQSATMIGVTGAPAGPITLGANFTITVELQNAGGSFVPLSGVPLTISIASGGGTLNGTVTENTDANGTASFSVNVTGTAGARTFTITGSGLTPATTASITFN